MNKPEPAFTLRPVRPDDEPFLLRLYGSLREEELAPTGWSPAQTEAFLRMQLQAQREAYEQRFPDAEYRVILRDGRPAGRIWVGRSASEIRLLDIALLPEDRGAGIGTALVRELILEAAEAGKPLRHMVDKGNLRGIRFYGRLGFSIVEEMPTHFLMEFLPPQPRNDPGVTRGAG